VVAVPAKALERDDDPAMIGVEPLGVRERRGPGQLAEHLALAWATDVELVQERRDRLVVAAEQLQALEGVVVQLGELLLGRFVRGSGGRVRHRRAIV
jgi:hypothetical protein